MAKTFRRTGHVYQRHPTGAPDGVISAPIAKESGITGEVFSVNSGQGEAQRKRFWKGAGFFLPATDYEGRYCRIYNTPPDGSNLSTGKTGFRHEDQIYLIKTVDGSGDFVELEGARFEDDSTLAALTVTMDVFAGATFTAASAVLPAEPHTSNDAGPVVHQSLVFPNPAAKKLSLVPFMIGKRLSATSVIISDLFGALDTIPTEASLEWYLKDRSAYSMRDMFYVMARFLLDAGWTLVQNRGRWLAGQSTGFQRINFDDMVFFSDGEDNAKSMYLRMTLHHRNNQGTTSADGAFGGTQDSTNDAGFSFALFPIWDPTIVHGGSNVDRNDGAGINALMIDPSITIQQNHHAAWDRNDGTSNGEPVWNPDQAAYGTAIPTTVGGTFSTPWRESFFQKNNAYFTDASGSGFRPHPMKFPMGGTFHELDYVLFGDKDEVFFLIDQEGFGMNSIHMGSLEPLPSQIQHSFFTTAPVRSGANSVVRVGTQNPEALPSGPNYQVGDNLQLVGLRVDGVDFAGLSHTGEFIETAFIQAIGTVGAVGRITCVAKALLQTDDSDDFTIDDGEGNVITFYYDTDGLGGGVGTAINVSGDTTANDVAISTQAAIAGSALNITATVNGDFVDLVHNTPNSAPTNVAIVESVTEATFLVEGMEGSGYGFTVDVLNNEYATGALAGEDPNPLFQAVPYIFATPFASSNAVRVSNRARNGDVSYFDHNGQQNAQNDGHGFAADLTLMPYDSNFEIDPSVRTNRFGLLGVFVRDAAGSQWRGRLRYMHLLSKRVRRRRFVRDRDGNYYYTIPHNMAFETGMTLRRAHTYAIGPMPAGLAIPG